MRSDLPGQLELPETTGRPADLARHRAAAPLRPTVPQELCNFGLFAPAPAVRAADLFTADPAK